MTACAMTIGMVPMAMAWRGGAGMQAPLGRAVIGGLVMSTVATLLVVPSIFAIVIGRKKAHSPSISPEDPGAALRRGCLRPLRGQYGDRGLLPRRASPSRFTHGPAETATPRPTARQGHEPAAPRNPPLTRSP